MRESAKPGLLAQSAAPRRQGARGDEADRTAVSEYTGAVG